MTHSYHALLHWISSLSQGWSEWSCRQRYSVFHPGRNESELIESVKCLWPAGLPGERARDLRVFAVLQETLLDHQLSRHILVQTPSRCVHIHHCPTGCWLYHEHGREKPSRDPRSAPAARKLSAAHVIKNSTRTIHSNTTCESISAHEQILWCLNPLICDNVSI